MIISKNDKGCVFTSERLDKNYCPIQGWKDFVLICVMHQTSFWRARSNVHKDDWVEINFKKEQIESLYFPEG